MREKLNPHSSPPGLPRLFREALATAGMPAIDAWWTQLDDPSRREALDLWHDCHTSDCGLTVRAEAVAIDDSTDETGDFWHSDNYEYLVNHEIYLFNVPGVHICTRHPAAQTVARNGVIPHDFACPFASADCPMKTILGQSPGKSVRLRITLTRRRLMTLTPHSFSAPSLAAMS